MDYIHLSPGHWSIQDGIGVLNWVSWLHVWAMLPSVCPGTYVPIYRLFVSDSFALKDVTLKVSIYNGENAYFESTGQNTLLAQRTIGDTTTGAFVDLRLDPITLNDFQTLICEMVDFSGSSKWGLKIESIRLFKLNL